LIWIAVDAVGVPLLVRAGYYPSALLYAIYGGFCVWGLVVWQRARARLAAASAAGAETAQAPV
jgi:nicotinamide mononucleotide transporter